MDNQTAKLAIALQLHDLDQLERSGSLDKAVIDVQRQQLEIDSGFDNVAFESSRRLAVSMAKAIEDDSVVLARATRVPQLDDATFRRLAALNQLPPPSTDAGSLTPSLTPMNHSNSSLASQVLPSIIYRYIITNSVKVFKLIFRYTFFTVVHNQHHGGAPRPDEKPPCSTEMSVNQAQEAGSLDSDRETHLDQQFQASDTTKSHQHSHNSVEERQRSTGGDQSGASNGTVIPTESAASSAANDTVPLKAECASCGNEDVKRLIKVSCEHHYCRDCFENFVEACLETRDGFPPYCCKTPIAFNIVANNVSVPLFHRYRSRQEEIKDATALYCGFSKCGVKIQADKVHDTTATCVTCTRDTCMKCRGEMPRDRKDKHICKKDPGREAVLALAKREGWQACYKCGTMVSLNFGCHHMTCRCKAEFCYKCGTPWRSCDCGDYDEPRLLDRAIRAMGIRAARRVARYLPPDPRPREQQLTDLVRKLQVDCDHNDFRWEHRTEEHPGHCDICEYEGWEYILPCENCRFTSCRECHNYHGWNGGEAPWGHSYNFFELWGELIRTNVEE